MNIFEILKDILYRKQNNLLSNEENESEFQPYIVSRWLSFHSPNTAKLLNSTINKLYTTFDNKQQWYNILIATIPKTYFKKINYIKKKKEKKSDDDKVLEFLANNYQLSKREIECYIKEYNIDIKELKKALGEK